MNYYKNSGLKAQQIKYLIIASFFGFVGGGTAFLLTFNIPIAPYGVAFFVLYPIIVAYAVTKHHLFDIRVISTEIFVFTLSIIALVKTVTVENIQERVINGVILLSIIIVGISLIRSVIREIKQREKIEGLAKELEKALEAEKKANDMLELFMIGLQHNIKGHLAPIILTVPSLIDGSGAYSKLSKRGLLLNDGGIDMIKRYEKRAIEARDQADDFMAIAKFRQGKTIVSLDSAVELDALLEELAGSFKIEADLSGIVLEFEKSGDKFVVSADQVKLKSALQNIIGNAIKYTPKGKVAIKITKEEGNKVLIEVKDTGIGIPPDKLATLFNSPFERTAEARKTAGGFGFGLYFASLIIGLHNGKIWVESEGENKGSTFYIELPIG